jgi:hypothetical protein
MTTLKELHQSCDMRWDDRCMVIGACHCKYIILEQQKQEEYLLKLKSNERERNKTKNERVDG